MACSFTGSSLDVPLERYLAARQSQRQSQAMGQWDREGGQSMGLVVKQRHHAWRLVVRRLPNQDSNVLLYRQPGIDLCIWAILRLSSE